MVEGKNHGTQGYKEELVFSVVTGRGRLGREDLTSGHSGALDVSLGVLIGVTTPSDTSSTHPDRISC